LILRTVSSFSFLATA